MKNVLKIKLLNEASRGEESGMDASLEHDLNKQLLEAFADVNNVVAPM